ncbi:MAG: hypothetical protein DMD53_04075 [Gemmatimonadetes bacterium]|nr:MAG: hypothetical protein DMD53_04075 [Gemmatimonadota bacterium]
MPPAAMPPPRPPPPQPPPRRPPAPRGHARPRRCVTVRASCATWSTGDCTYSRRWAVSRSRRTSAPRSSSSS